MKNYLGEKILNWKETPEFSNFKKEDWIIYFVNRYGSIDGERHKQWLLDQIVRITLGCEIQVKEASWDNGNKEYRINIVSDSEKYINWLEEWYEPLGDIEDDVSFCTWKTGIAP